MHSIESNVPAFLIKLWKLVEDCSCDDLISWNEVGNSFIIHDDVKFSSELLPRYFKHNNMASFIRQLNMYGFRKLANYERGSLLSENKEMQFHNPYFIKGNEDLLDCIKRKIPAKGGGESSSGGAGADAKDLLTDLTSIRERQESMNNLLISMKNENELLWRELSALRQKHKTQEQIIQKVIQFLVTLVRTGKPNVGVKRPMARMLRNIKSPNPVKSHSMDVVRSKGSDLFITVPTEKLSSPLGPVIHEVLDQDELGSPLSTISKDSGGRSFSENCLGSQSSDSVDPVDSKVSLVASGETECEQVLGLAADFITSDGVCIPDIASVLSLTEDGSTAGLSADKFIGEMTPVETDNVISIPDAAAYVSIAEDVSNLITVPEGTNVISLLNSTTETKKSDADSTTKAVSSLKSTANPSLSLLIPRKPDVGECSIDMDTDMEPSSILGKIHDSEDDYDDIEKLDFEPLATPKILEAFDKALEVFGNPNNNKLSGKKSSLSSKHVDSNDLQLSIPGPQEKIRNSLSSHVQNVEDNLDWLQNHLSPDVLNVDPAFLLSLFSPEGDVNNMAFDCQFNTDNVLRDTDVNVVGKELVQFNPAVLDTSFDVDTIHSYFDFVPEVPADQKPTEKHTSIKREKLSNFDSDDAKLSPSPAKKSRSKPLRKKALTK